MILWWIGNVVFVVVIIPAVVLILHRLLRPVLQIQGFAHEIAERGALFGPHIAEAVEELATTQRLVSEVRPELERYGRALERLS